MLKKIGKASLLVSLLAAASVAFAQAGQQQQQQQDQQQQQQEQQQPQQPQKQQNRDLRCPSIETIQSSADMLDMVEHIQAKQGNADIVFTSKVAFSQSQQPWHVAVVVYPAPQTQEESKNAAKATVSKISSMKSEFAVGFPSNKSISWCYYGDNNEVIAVAGDVTSPQTFVQQGQQQQAQQQS